VGERACRQYPTNFSLSFLSLTEMFSMGGSLAQVNDKPKVCRTWT